MKYIKASARPDMKFYAFIQKVCFIEAFSNYLGNNQTGTIENAICKYNFMFLDVDHDI